MSDSNLGLNIWVFSKNCHYILSHSFKKKKKKNKRHNGHTDITDWEIVQDRYKEKSERVRSDRKISVRVVWWKSRRTWRQSEVLWFFWVILKIQRKSIPCCPIISCLALSFIRDMEHWCNTCSSVTKPTLYSPIMHLAQSENQSPGLFYFLFHNTARHWMWDTLPKTKKVGWHMIGQALAHDNFLNQWDCKVRQTQ